MILADGTMGQMMEPVEIPKLENTSECDKSWAVTGTGNAAAGTTSSIPFPSAPTELERHELRAVRSGIGRIQEKEAMVGGIPHGGRANTAWSPSASRRGLPRAAINEARDKGHSKVGHDPAHHPVALPGKGPGGRGGEVRSLPATVELNMGQMIDDVRLAISVQTAGEADSSGAGGIIPSPEEVLRRNRKHGRRCREMMVFERPHALSDVPLHYCPGCTHGIVHRLVAEVIDELGIEGKHHRRRAGGLRGDGV